jgi:catechol 2,3-dioxygenase-like lactoylglutathione lyase family enzyme
MDLGRFETSLDVKDIAASLAFYRALGFRQVDGGVDIKVVGLRKGDCRLSLYQGHLDPPRTQLIFWQGDVMAIARQATEKGLRFEAGHPRRSKDGASAMLIDPDGHPLYFINLPVNFYNQPGHERKAPRYRPTILQPDRKLGWFELGLVTRDVGRAHAFYDKLGFQFVERNDDGRSVTLQSGDCRLGLYQDVLDPPVTQLIFFQGDLDAIGRDLAAAGRAFVKGPFAGPGGALGAMTLDPDGHPLYFDTAPGRVRAAPAAPGAAARDGR